MGGRHTAQSYVWFAEETDQLVLWQHAGDPEAWRYVDFSREN
jgi:hypothetical protein